MKHHHEEKMKEIPTPLGESSSGFDEDGNSLNKDGYNDDDDDGLMADLALIVDMDDNVLRRERGETDYLTALEADLLPRVMDGPIARFPRREQKIMLVKLLFSDEGSEEDMTPQEVWIESESVDDADYETKKNRIERFSSARTALMLSSVLRQTACVSLSLSEISKSRLRCFGKAGGEDALRCANKAIEIASDGFWDRDDVEIEGRESPVIDPNREKNATAPGLRHEQSLKFLDIRLSNICLRSAYLQKGNALAALGREDEARAAYKEILPFFEREPRCVRLDWERVSNLVNIGNTFSRQGDYEKANEQYTVAESLGREHIDNANANANNEGGNNNHFDGTDIVIVSMRARAFALKRAGKEEEGKVVLRVVIAMQIQLNSEKAEDLVGTEAKKAAATAAAVQGINSISPIH